jgi:hypothetical protein
VQTLHHTLNLVEAWLEEADTDPDLLDCIAEYAYGCGGCTMVKICNGLGDQFQQMAWDQDAIGWRRFTEGMICMRMRRIQSDYHYKVGMRMNPEWWVRGLIPKLLEATHGQWIYQNIQIHDSIPGTQVTLRKEAIHCKIEKQMEMGKEGLLEKDHWMMEVNLGYLELLQGNKKNTG